MSQPTDRKYWGMVAAAPAPVVAAMARTAESQGLYGVMAAQVWGPPFVPLAAAAMASQNLKLLSGIAIAAARSPFETAVTAIDLDRVSEGRFILGLGSSVLAVTQGYFGAPEHRPLEHLRETVEVVRYVVRGGHRGLAPFKGKYFSAGFAGLQLAPPVREEIPIWVAGLRGPAIRLGAEVADGVMGHPIWSVDWAIKRVQDDLKRGLDRGGRRREDVHLQLGFFVAINSNVREAIEDARPTVAFYASAVEYAPFFEAHGFGEQVRRLHALGVWEHGAANPAELVPDDMVRTFALCGTADDVRRQVDRAWTVADSMVLLPPFRGLAPEKSMYYSDAVARTFYN